jgi:hypothetical protein
MVEVGRWTRAAADLREFAGLGAISRWAELAAMLEAMASAFERVALQHYTGGADEEREFYSADVAVLETVERLVGARWSRRKP